MQSSPNEHGGRLVHDIAPDPKNFKLRATNSSHGTKALGFHTENPYTQSHGNIPGPPDALILLGVRPDPTAATGLLSISKVLDGVSPSSRAQLQKSQFLFRSGASHAKLEEIQAPVVQMGDAENPGRFRFLAQAIGSNRLIPLSNPAKAALDDLEHSVQFLISKGESKAVILEKGEAVVFNNGSFIGDQVGGSLHARVGHITNETRLVKRGLAYRNDLSA